MVLISAIKTSTKFRGIAPIDFLHNRLREILSKNSWLMGKLTRNNDGQVELLAPCYDSGEKVNIQGHFKLVDDLLLDGSESYEHIVERMNFLGVKRGVECIDNNEPLFRLAIVQPPGLKEFYLVCSMSHVLGDGHTFYRIYSMFDFEQEVKSLTFDRFLGFYSELQKCTGGTAFRWANHPFIPLVWQLLPFLRHHSTPCMYAVNGNWLREEKERYKERVGEQNLIKENDKGFISSNDILSAWFFNLCGAPMGCIAMNYRNRVWGVGNDHAGNYQSIITFNEPSDFAEPEDIRRAVRHYSCRSCSAAPSYFWDWYKYFNLALCTNWAGMYHHVHLPRARDEDCDHVVHMPLITTEELRIWPSLLVIFRMDEHRLGVISSSRCLDSIDAQSALTAAF